MPRIKVSLKYDGSDFNGFQIQKDPKLRTVQGELTKAISLISKKEIVIHGSGRTDAKVHANSQVIHFDTDYTMSSSEWLNAINSNLPKDIIAYQVEHVADNFHARFSATGKEYIYLLNMFEYEPKDADYIYQYNHFLNIDKMIKAAKLFIGEHDFRNFSANEEEEVSTYTRKIDVAAIDIKDRILRFRFSGNGFLRHMVRSMVGILIEIGRGRADESEITKRLDTVDRDPIPYRAEPQGLYLEEVFYPVDNVRVKHNYHTHTYRCNHANGADEDYVLAAIKNNYKTLGFSDHMMVPGVDLDTWTRGTFAEFPGYVSSLRFLKQKYKDVIDIHLGMECEYFPELETFLRGLLTSNQLDYLVFANHYRNFDGSTFSDYYGYATSDGDVLEYTLSAIAALKTGLFSVFAHPDLFMARMIKWTPVMEQCSYMLAEAAKELDIPLEINQGGIRYSIGAKMNISKRYMYPYHKFWEIVKKVGNQVVIGVDAHNPKDFGHEAVKLSYKFAEDLGIKISEKINFKKVKK